MTHADVFTRLSGTTGSAAAGQSIATATAAAPVYSTNWLDMDAGGALRTKREIRDLHALFWPTTTVNSATNTATIDLEIVMVPTTTPATPTLAAFDNTTAVAGAVITSVAHGLPNGTRITVAQTSGTLNTTSGGGGGGSAYAVATNLFIVNATADTFGISSVPGGAPFIFVDQVGTTTVTWFAEVVGSQAKVALERLIANVAQAQPRINPILLGPGNGVPVHRYLFARYVPTADLTAGVMFCDIRSGAPMSNFPINPNNYVTP